MIRIIIILIFIGNYFFSDINAATVESLSSGSWNITSTWVGGVIPSVNDDVIIKSGHSVTLLDNRSCISLTIENDATFIHNGTLTQSGNVNNLGTISWSTGIFSGTGVIINNGTLIITSNFQPHNTASNIINNGTINWNEGQLDGGIGGQVLTNTGTLNLNSSGNTLGMSVVNTGTITRGTPGSVSFSQPVDNQVSGIITIPSGVTFSFDTGSTITQSGTFTVDGSLNFSATGTHIINTVNSFSGTGTINIINSPTFNGSVGWQPIIPVVNHAGTLSWFCSFDHRCRNCMELVNW
ncbi:MAG: hypothetical protein IPM42_19580 [Saprospiraceae bacterium]|nr:hypothetical protein [Saprospiraceae bacterium]